MKYQNEVTIDLPLQEVVAKFDNPENFKHWQPGLISSEHLSGEPRKPGAKMRLRFKIGKREIEMVETIKVNNLPEEFSGSYETKGMYNTQSNTFAAIEPDKTLYRTENEFLGQGIFKVMLWLMPASFKNQSQKYMDLFKDFAENGNSVLNN